MNKILLALAALAIVSVNSFAPPPQIPDTSSSLPLLGLGLGCLAMARTYFGGRK